MGNGAQSSITEAVLRYMEEQNMAGRPKPLKPNQKPLR